jgi:hypothetical protein
LNWLAGRHQQHCQRHHLLLLLLLRLWCCLHVFLHHCHHTHCSQAARDHPLVHLLARARLLLLQQSQAQQQQQADR